MILMPTETVPCDVNDRIAASLSNDRTTQPTWGPTIWLTADSVDTRMKVERHDVA